MSIFSLDLDVSDWADQVGKRAVCVLTLQQDADFDGYHLNILRELGDQEWEDYSFALAVLVAQKTAGRLQDAVRQNYDEFADAFNALHVVGRGPTDEATRSALDDLINRRLSNYLSSMRLFLDHLEYRLKRLYGKSSEQALGLRACCSRLFDTVFAYRFAYKLRNYTQHFGAPVWDVAVTSSLVEGTTDQVIYTARAAFDLRALLIVGRDCWGPVRKDLESLPPSLDVATVMRDLPAALDAVWRTFLEVQRKYIEGAAKVVEETLGAGDAAASVFAGEWVNNNGLLAFDFNNPPVDVIEWLRHELTQAEAVQHAHPADSCQV
jgi:hypothetical protein